MEDCKDIKILSLSPDEVERLLREYKQNQELVRRLGSRYYQVVYPIQVRAIEAIEEETHFWQYGRVMCGV